MIRCVRLAAHIVTLVGALLSTVRRADAEPEYQITDLSALAGGPVTFANAINNRGDVAGITGTSGNFRAFLYSGGTLTFLPTPAETTGSVAANGLNDTGQIVGSLGVSTGT